MFVPLVENYAKDLPLRRPQRAHVRNPLLSTQILPVLALHFLLQGRCQLTNCGL